jgi:hypothetical protein
MRKHHCNLEEKMSYTTANFYTQQLINLNARLKVLQAHLHRSKVNELERELNVCQAHFQMLYDYANQHQIDISSFYAQLTDITTVLEMVKQEIVRKKCPLWKRILGKVAGFLGCVLGWFGIHATFLPDNKPFGYLV